MKKSNNKCKIYLLCRCFHDTVRYRSRNRLKIHPHVDRSVCWNEKCFIIHPKKQTNKQALFQLFFYLQTCLWCRRWLALKGSSALAHRIQMRERASLVKLQNKTKKNLNLFYISLGYRSGYE